VREVVGIKNTKEKTPREKLQSIEKKKGVNETNETRSAYYS
jgi:hypothetical protein